MLCVMGYFRKVHSQKNHHILVCIHVLYISNGNLSHPIFPSLLWTPSSAMSHHPIFLIHVSYHPDFLAVTQHTYYGTVVIIYQNINSITDSSPGQLWSSLETEDQTSIWTQLQVLVLHHILHLHQISDVCGGGEREGGGKEKCGSIAIAAGQDPLLTGIGSETPQLLHKYIQ